MIDPEHKKQRILSSVLIFSLALTPVCAASSSAPIENSQAAPSAPGKAAGAQTSNPQSGTAGNFVTTEDFLMDSAIARVLTSKAPSRVLSKQERDAVTLAFASLVASLGQNALGIPPPKPPKDITNPGTILRPIPPLPVPPPDDDVGVLDLPDPPTDKDDEINPEQSADQDDAQRYFDFLSALSEQIRNWRKQMKNEIQQARTEAVDQQEEQDVLLESAATIKKLRTATPEAAAALTVKTEKTLTHLNEGLLTDSPMPQMEEIEQVVAYHNLFNPDKRKIDPLFLAMLRQSLNKNQVVRQYLRALEKIRAAEKVDNDSEFVFNTAMPPEESIKSLSSILATEGLGGFFKHKSSAE